MRATTVVVVGVVAVALAAASATAVAQPSTDAPARIDGSLASHADPSPAFAVAPRPDGSARIHVTSAFDLDDARAAAFEELRTNESATAAFEERFRARMEAVAADAAEATGREMAVRDAELTLRTVAGTGIAELSLTWEGLAAVEGDRLVVTEPFASGFESSRPVHLLVPDGYSVASATPGPTDRDDGQLTWAAGTDLDGFAVTLEADGTADGNGTDGGRGPGFGALAAVGAAGTAIALARWRW